MQFVVNTFGASVRQAGERFVVRVGGREQAVSAHKVTSLVIATGAVPSTDAIRLAVANNVDIVFLDQYGDPDGRVWPPRLGSTTAVRRRQLEAAAGPDALAFARGWVDAELRHQAEFLAELARRRAGSAAAFGPALDAVAACRVKLAALTGTLDDGRGTVTGLEGPAGRVYFDCLSGQMPENYRFAGRSRHPATDPFNATLNYAYGILYSHVERACILAGLDPCAGFLHTDNKPWGTPFGESPPMVELVLATGNRVGLPYAWLSEVTFDPSAGVTLAFTTGTAVAIRGRHLGALYAALVSHQAVSVREADPPTAGLLGGGVPVVEGIRVDRGPP